MIKQYHDCQLFCHAVPSWASQQIRPKIKRLCVSGYPTVPNILPPTLNFFKHFYGISMGFPSLAIYVSPSSHVKTFNQIKIFPLIPFLF